MEKNTQNIVPQPILDSIVVTIAKEYALETKHLILSDVFQEQEKIFLVIKKDDDDTVIRIIGALEKENFLITKIANSSRMTEKEE